MQNEICNISIVNSAHGDLTVYTGTVGTWSLTVAGGASHQYYIHSDDKVKAVPIPGYFWVYLESNTKVLEK